MCWQKVYSRIPQNVSIWEEQVCCLCLVLGHQVTEEATWARGTVLAPLPVAPSRPVMLGEKRPMNIGQRRGWCRPFKVGGYGGDLGPAVPHGHQPSSGGCAFSGKAPKGHQLLLQQNENGEK